MRPLRSRLLRLATAASMGFAAPRLAVAQASRHDLWAQTFLSPAQPATITEILFGSLAFTPNTIFDLRQFAATGPTGASLFQFQDPSAHALEPYSLDLNVLLAPNTVYAIVLAELGNGGVGAFLDSAFPSGELWEKPLLEGWRPISGFEPGTDLRGFNVVYDNASPAIVSPEPSTLTLTATGLVLMLVVIRRRRRAGMVAEQLT